MRWRGPANIHLQACPVSHPPEHPDGLADHVHILLGDGLGLLDRVGGDQVEFGGVAAADGPIARAPHPFDVSAVAPLPDSRMMRRPHRDDRSGMGVAPRLWITRHDHQPDEIDPTGWSLALCISLRTGSGWLTLGGTLARENAEARSRNWRSPG